MEQFKLTPQSDTEWESLQAELEIQVQSGAHDLCRRTLLNLSPKAIPRKWAAGLARIAWRSDSSLQALKILQTYIYPDNELSTPATPNEKIQYAISLSNLGIVREALDLLKTINADEEPEALFQAASAHMTDWNYSAAIEPLQQMSVHPRVAPYRKLVAKVNLIAAYISISKFDKATDLLVEVQEECERNNHLLLLGNSWELLAQIQIARNQLPEAQVSLAKAGEILKVQGGRYLLFVDKWKAVLQCLQASSLEEKKMGICSLQKVRENAVEVRHWNTLRECDLFEAIASKNEYLLRKVIMGTPSETYRRRVRGFYGRRVIATGKFKFRMEVSNPRQDNHLDSLFDPRQKQKGKEALFEKPLLFSLYHALLRDFYQPHSMGTLFAQLYPTEKYNPYSSPGRTRQLMRRLTEWFSQYEIPLRVHFQKNECRLIALAPIDVIVQRGSRQTAMKARDEEIRKQLRGKIFSISQLAEVMAASEPTAERWIRKEITEGKLVKDRRKSGTVYRITKIAS